MKSRATPAGRTAAETHAAELKVERALWHFEIGMSAFNARLPVDWAYVASRMAGELGDWPVPEPSKRPRATEVPRREVG